jgi:hypothetical protein
MVPPPSSGPAFFPPRVAVRGPRSRLDRIAGRLPAGRRPPAQLYINDPGVVRSSPVSSQVFRPERIIGHPP